METFLGLDYPTWWFLIIGAVFSGYAILDGFDLGAGALHLFLRKEESRRIAINAIGPVWDGNEVWLVIGGGALFAGFPEVYATLFSAFYIPFMLFLVALIFRAISIEFRGKEPMAWWKKLWDWSYSISSILLAVLLGVVVGNLILGFPLDEQGVYRGSWLSFVNPFAVLTGLVTLFAFAMHGGLYLLLKTQGRLFQRMRFLLRGAMIGFILTLVLATLYVLLYIPHMSDKLRANPWMFALPVVLTLLLANIPREVIKGRYLRGFISSALVLAVLLMVVSVELFPVLLFDPVQPQNSLDIYKAASSDKSLGIMLTVAAIGVPLVAIYTAFVFWTFRGKVKVDEHSY